MNPIHKKQEQDIKARIVPFNHRLRVFDVNPRQFFQDGFTQIYETRMKSLPIVHKGLRVNVGEFRRWGNDWLGSVVTPWSIMILWVPGNRESWKDSKAGEAVEIELPAGDFAFLTARDPILGEYRQLSLASPVTHFEDQAAADLFAKVAFDTILTIPADEVDQFMEESKGTPLTPPSGNGKVIPIKAVAAKPGMKAAPSTGAGSHPRAQDDQASAIPQVERAASAPEKRVTRRDFFKRYSVK